MQRSQILVETRIRIATAIVVGHDVFERRETPVVHVGSGLSHLPQGRHFESAAIFVSAFNLEPAGVEKYPVAPRNAGVVEAIVSQIGPHMADRATSLSSKHSPGPIKSDRKGPLCRR